MKVRPANFIGACLVSALIWTPVLAWAQAPNPDHHPEASCPGWATGHMAGGGGAISTALDAKIDELVKKMNAAKGAAKVDAMAELLTALASDRRVMDRHMMANMSMMSMMNQQAMMNMRNSSMNCPGTNCQGMMREMPGMKDKAAAPPDASSPEAAQPDK